MINPFLAGALLIVGAIGFGFLVTWFVFDVNVTQNDPKDPNRKRPLGNSKEGWKFWKDFTENREKFSSDREWRLDYEKNNPHPYNEVISTRP